MSGEKTEAPTERRREEARRKGQGVGRSHELAQVMTLVAGLVTMSAFLPSIAAEIASSVQQHVALVAVGTAIPPESLMSDVGDAIRQSVWMVLPLGLAVMIAGVAGSLAGGGFIVSLQAVGFQSSRLNPISGLKRIVDKTAFTRLLISVTKLAILTVVSYQVITSRVQDLVGMNTSTGAMAGRAFSSIFELGLTIAVLLAAVALADWIIQRRRAEGSLKMTKDDVKREYKEQEGDPLVRAQRKAMARRMAFARMMDDIAGADVVLVNPTRIAIALKYDPKTMRAPRIVAKGQRLTAARIREQAKKHNVPIIQDVQLARALFPNKVGAEVPAHLYKAVARILVLVAKLRAGTARPAPRRQPAPRPITGLPTWFEGTNR
jgi:flagellar biosynthesis protein FlhB